MESLWVDCRVFLDRAGALDPGAGRPVGVQGQGSDSDWPE
jgi:hypothetical protein